MSIYFQQTTPPTAGRPPGHKTEHKTEHKASKSSSKYYCGSTDCRSSTYSQKRLTVEFNHNICDESFSYQVVLDRTVGSAVHYWFHFYWIGESLSRFQFESLLSVTTCINPHQHFIMFYASICKSSHPPIKWKLYEFNGLMSNGSNLVYEAF